jgi:hypothetical protein
MECQADGLVDIVMSNNKDDKIIRTEKDDRNIGG